MRALLVVTLVGCSSTPPSEGPVGPVGPATVRVTRAGVPVADAAVVSSATDGSVLATGTSDVDGRITFDVEPSGMVTVIDPKDPKFLFTVTAMQPSTFTEVPLAASVLPMPKVATLTVGAPPDAAPVDTFGFYVETPCGTFETLTLPATFDISADCFAEDRVPVIVTAATENKNLENPGHPLAHVAGFATGSPTSVALTPETWSKSCMKVDAFVADRMQITFHSRLGGHLFGAYPSYCDVGMPAPGFTYAYPVLDFGEGVTTTSFGYVGGGSLRSATLVKNLSRVPSQFDVGRAPELLTGNVALVEMDDRRVEWTRDRDLAAADVIFANLVYNANTKFTSWKFLLAGTATSIELPEIPGITLATTTSRMAEVRYLDASWITRVLDIPSLTGLDAHMPEQPLDTHVRGFEQQFFPDSR